MQNRTERAGNCRFCGVELDNDYFCSGCGEFICDDCDVSCGEIPFGGHDPFEHRISPGEEDDEGD